MNNRGVEDNIVSQNIIQTGCILRFNYFVPCCYGIFDHRKTSQGKGVFVPLSFASGIIQLTDITVLHL
jgi:hypothetical protein